MSIGPLPSWQKLIYLWLQMKNADAAQFPWKLLIALLYLLNGDQTVVFSIFTLSE